MRPTARSIAISAALLCTLLAGCGSDEDGTHSTTNHRPTISNLTVPSARTVAQARLTPGVVTAGVDFAIAWEWEDQDCDIQQACISIDGGEAGCIAAGLWQCGVILRFDGIVFSISTPGQHTVAVYAIDAQANVSNIITVEVCAESSDVHCETHDVGATTRR